MEKRALELPPRDKAPYDVVDLMCMACASIRGTDEQDSPRLPGAAFLSMLLVLANNHQAPTVRECLGMGQLGFFLILQHQLSAFASAPSNRTSSPMAGTRRRPAAAA